MVCMPKKKPNGRDLSEDHKEESKRISDFQAKLTHAIDGVKICLIAKECFRFYKFGFDVLVMLACGLHNFRISQK